jgi:MYXO-CTERM domain-containing protein
MTSRIAGVLVVDRDEPAGQGGCSISGGAAKPAGLLGLVALLALLIRRRRG